MVNDLKSIKKHYGEDMMHFCRTYFPSYLETPGLLYSMIDSKFAHNKALYDDLVKQDLDYSFVKELTGKEPVINYLKVEGTPKELLSKAGYDLYECNTNDEILSFKKYYAPKEAICTFKEKRLDKCHVFFAVKKNVDEIRREDFINPKREDEYGTSVISIQFNRNINMISIKNRYNHIVKNPDYTFNCNLENIIPGLTNSFNETYNFDIKKEIKEFKPKGYVKSFDNKYYRYNHFINNIYYCNNNMIIDNYKLVTKYHDEPERYIIGDYFIFDLKEKKVFTHDNNINDPFINQFKNTKDIKMIKSKNGKSKMLIIKTEEGRIYVEIDRKGHIIFYKNDNIKQIDDGFLMENKDLELLDIRNVTKIGNNAFKNNKKLKVFDIRNTEVIGNNVLMENKEVEIINAPIVKKIGNYLLNKNLSITKIIMPELEYIGDYCFTDNKAVDEVDFRNLIKAGSFLLTENQNLEEIIMDNLITCGTQVLSMNEKIVKSSFKNLLEAPSGFLAFNVYMEECDFRNLKKAGTAFLGRNTHLKRLYTPNLIKTANECLASNVIMEEFYAPKLVSCDSNFLTVNKGIKNLNFESLVRVGPNFMKESNPESINIPLLEERYYRFLNEFYKQKINSKVKVLTR